MNTSAGAPPSRRQWLATLSSAAVGALTGAPARAQPPRSSALVLHLQDMAYLHRASHQGQHEFTPEAQHDLERWTDMLTLNVHPAVRGGEQLAEVANRVLGNYRQHGKILHTRSLARTATQPAQHFIAAALGRPELLEAAFARCVLHEGVGLVVVRSHRIYGRAVGPQMSRWLEANGPAVETALLAWSGIPALQALQKLG